MIVVIPEEDSKADIYINDTTTATNNIGDNTKRAAAAVALAIYIIEKPMNPNDPISWNDLIFLSKNLA